MLHLGRSGSTVVGDLMNQHPNVHWDGEIYQHALSTGVASTIDPLVHFHRRMARAGPHLWCGEVKLQHLVQLGLQPEKFLQETDELGASIVILERRNYLRKIISSAVVRQTSRFHLPAGQRLRLAPIEVDVNRFIHQGVARPLVEHLHAIQQDYETLRQLTAGRKVLFLTYEEHVEKDPTVAYREICRFAGLPGHEVKVRLAKVNTYALERLIANYEQLREHLCGTSFAWMLDT